MKSGSFRIRLALLAAALSGAVLAGFGAYAWWVVHDIKVADIDSDLISSAERESMRFLPPPEWARFAENVLPRSLGIREPAHVLLLVEDRFGEIVFESGNWPAGIDSSKLPWPKAKLPPWPPDFSRPPPRIPPATAKYEASANGTTWRFGLAATPHSRIAIAVGMDEMRLGMDRVRNGFLLAAPAALAFLALGAWFLSGRALKPVRELGQSIRGISAQKLDQRLPVIRDREFAVLAEGINEMLERLEKSFTQASRFSADASHELKTPLTILQGQIERAISQVEAGSPMQAMLGSILDEARRLSSISRKLLLLSQADAGRLRLQLTPFDLSREVEELVEDTRMMAPALLVSVKLPEGITIRADADLMRQLLVNLVSNAVKYNLQNGWIRIGLERTEQVVQVEISNSSSGIAPESREKIFERFYRTDASRSRNVDGVGLGLSLAREIARAHGGDLVLLDSPRGEVSFRISLPC